MSSMQDDHIFRENISVGCECFNPNLSNLLTENTIDYVKNKKSYIIKYLMNVVIHKSKSLIGIRRCYGKRDTNCIILQSSYRSHQNTLRKFREFTIKKKPLKLISLPYSEKKITVEKFISTITSVCETFENIFTNIFSSNHMVNLDFLIKSCQFHLQTINIFEEVLSEENKVQNGRGIEAIQYKSCSNASI